MGKRVLYWAVSASIAGVGVLSPVGRAALIGADDASQAAYASAWANGSNGGSGFGPWAIAAATTVTGNTAFFGSFVGDSTTNGATPPSGGINTGAARSWGLYANTSNTENAVRPFQADSNGATALTSRQRLSFRIDNGTVANGASVGVSLRTSTGANRLELFFGGGNANYTLADSIGNRNTNVPFTDGGVSVALTITGANSYSITLTPNTGSPQTLTGSFIGAPNSFDVAQFRAFNFNAGSGNGANFYLNSLAITKPVISITGGVPDGYGASLGSLAVVGGNGSYNLAQSGTLSGNIGYLNVSGFTPTTDTEIYGLQVLVNGSAPTPAQLTQLASAIGATASTSSAYPFPSGYNLFVTLPSALLPGGAQPYRFGYDFSTAAQALGNVTVVRVAVVPEPAAVALILLAAIPLGRRRRTL